MQSRGIGCPHPEVAEYTRIAAAEGAVLLKNEDGMLPLKKHEITAVFGRCQINTYRSGTGSGGSVHPPFVISILEGLRDCSLVTINEELASIYEQWVHENPFDDGGGGWANEPWYQEEMPLTDEIVHNAAKSSSKAIVVIGRTAGEDKDNKEQEGSFLLTKTEIKNLQLIAEYFDKIAVLLNVPNLIDLSFLDNPNLKDKIKAVMFVWHGGMVTGSAVADLISGLVSPSGKLVDTIAISLSDYPSYNNFGSKTENYYQEDIYVGYRYFETFQPENVRYEFGFGRSYTDFSFTIQSVEQCGEFESIFVNLSVLVTNTGNTSGKEVIQVYASCPQGVLGKPVRELCAFAKTKELKPKESEVLIFNVPIILLQSYDDSGITGHKSCYVLEAGTYRFFVGNSVRKTVESNLCVTLDDLVVVKECEEALAPLVSFKRIHPVKDNNNNKFVAKYENVPIRSVDLDQRIRERLPQEISITGDLGWKLSDVIQRKVSLEQFIAQLSEEELASLVRGEGMSSPRVTPGTASAFGGLTKKTSDYGIPVACTADGPSGIRMENGALASLLPIGTLLACSFNIPMMEELYLLEGRELKDNGIDCLLGPGMNLHRHPLNGRNFEYFSEDPYLTGCFAASMTRGVHKGGSEVTLKHFAANNQEDTRRETNSIVSERALRELYLRGFYIALKDGKAKSVMTTYNPLNHIYNASSYDLNTTILRREWGFDGIVMTDWWAEMNDPVKGGPSSRQNTAAMVRAQNDLYMVICNFGAETNSYNDNTISALQDGTLTVGELQRCAMNICRFLMNSGAMTRISACLPEVSVAPLRLSKEDTRTMYEMMESEQMICPVSASNDFCLRTQKLAKYKVSVRMKTDFNYAEQCTTWLLINDEHVSTLQLGGTDGVWVEQACFLFNACQGDYVISLKPVMSGIVVESVCFVEI